MVSKNEVRIRAKTHESRCRKMNEIKVICPKCRGINTVVYFGCIHNVMHEKCTKCGYIQEMSLVRCLKEG